MNTLFQRRYNPISETLTKVPWSVIGTLTWESDAASQYSLFANKLYKKDFNWLLSKTSSRLRLQRRHLCAYGKTEWGSGMHGHYHFLLARHGTEKVSPEVLAQTMDKLWKMEHRICKIEPFDQKLQVQAVRYQSKEEFFPNGQPIEPDEFYSQALMALMLRLSRKDQAAADLGISTILPGCSGRVANQVFASSPVTSSR
jgi:hypothetical protein